MVLSMMELIPSVEFLMQKLTDLKCQRLLIPGMTSAIALSMVQPLLLQKLTDPDGGDFLIPHRYWAQSENCQNLNIWTQDLDSNAKKPVMVWFHGGGYTNGSSIEGIAYDGKNLSEYGDVVVVTVNHRLNVLGYLDVSDYGEDYQYSGNCGVADLVASLKWVKENIANLAEILTT